MLGVNQDHAVLIKQTLIVLHEHLQGRGTAKGAFILDIGAPGR